jgi:dynein heavy chain, axonemal
VPGEDESRDARPTDLLLHSQVSTRPPCRTLPLCSSPPRACSEDGEVDLSLSSADGGFSRLFEFGVFNGEVLSGLASLMSHIYIPTIKKTAPASEGKDGNLRRELNTNMAKFEQQIRQVVQQVQGDVRLDIPSVTISDPDQSAEDYEVVSQLERALAEWSEVVAESVEGEHQKVARKINRSPLGEIEFWRERSTSLSALYEQINMPRVQAMLQVLKITENPYLNTFNFHFGELTKLFMEAKDNVKFLTTLERHFKYLTDGSFSVISDGMFSMLNGLKMVWVISR